MSTAQPTQEQEIADALRLGIEPGTVFELRAIGVPDRTPKGHAESAFFHYDDIDLAAQMAVKMDSTVKPKGINWTLNPINPQLLARSPRRFSSTKAVADEDVLRRRWLFIDCDPVRPAETSSSEAQLALAAERAEDVREYLRSQGWGEAVVCMSGNGRHLLYRIDMPNDAGTNSTIEGCLKALAARFDNDAVTIDPTVGNAARICRLYGTHARKGHSIEGFPHRRAEVVYVP